jgi:hypothetical protein
MTMTAQEEKVLRNFAERANACGTIYEVIAVLATPRPHRPRQAGAGMMSAGVFRKRWEVYCAGCELDLLHLISSDKHEAEAEARHNDGWGTRKGLWYCPECKDHPNV